MSGFDVYEWVRNLRTKGAPRGGAGGGGRGTMTGAPEPSGQRPAPIRRLIGIGLAFAVAYGVYFWEIRRVVVPADNVLILLKKDGSRSLPDGQVIIPTPPDKAKEPAKYDQWEKEFGDVNGIC